MKKLISRLLILSMTMMVFTGCAENTKSNTESTTESAVESNTTNWEENTHSDIVDPDYDTVFDQTKVQEINIKIDSEDWKAMQEDLEENVSTQNKAVGNRAEQVRPPMINGDISDVPANGGPAGEGPPIVEGESEGDVQNNRPDERERPPLIDGETGENPQVRESEENLPAEGRDQGETTTEGDYEPIWIESSITFNDITWDHVGIRAKGNSSLKSVVGSGDNKLSFKLDFDEFEDVYPEIDNQRFYGFKQLNLNSNYNDESLMREKVSADLFSEFGVPAANTSFYIVNVDYGEGSQFYGVYTLVEEMDDTGVDNLFGDDSGNLYKPDGTAASFASGSYNDESMEKKSNEEEANYSDVQALYEVINSEARLSNLESWKSDLEEVFNVDGFLKWLAVNTVIQNWDTYGNMTHNYYLYNNPETNKLEWIPWDNNEALHESRGNREALSLGLDEVNDNWPLIRYLLDDSEYNVIYDSYVDEFTQDIFTEEKMETMYNNYYELIKDYAYAEVEGYSFIKSDQSFDVTVETLKSHVIERNEAVQTYLIQ